jgi:hypothetical protein
VYLPVGHPIAAAYHVNDQDEGSYSAISVSNIAFYYYYFVANMGQS